MFDSWTYDRTPNVPVVVIETVGVDDVADLVALLSGGTPMQKLLTLTVRRQIRRHPGGQAALKRLEARGDPDAQVEVTSEGERVQRAVAVLTELVEFLSGQDVPHGVNDLVGRAMEALDAGPGTGS